MKDGMSDSRAGGTSFVQGTGRFVSETEPEMQSVQIQIHFESKRSRG